MHQKTRCINRPFTIAMVISRGNPGANSFRSDRRFGRRRSGPRGL